LVYQVPVPPLSWLPYQSVEPLQSGVGDPGGWPLQGTRLVVDRAAEGEKGPDPGEPIPLPDDELLLTTRAQPHHQHGRPRAVDPLDHPVDLPWPPVEIEGWGVGPHHHLPSHLVVDVPRRQLGNARGSTADEDRHLRISPVLQVVAGEEARSSHPPPEPGPPGPSPPSHTLP